MSYTLTQFLSRTFFSPSKSNTYNFAEDILLTMHKVSQLYCVDSLVNGYWSSKFIISCFIFKKYTKPALQRKLTFQNKALGAWPGCWQPQKTQTAPAYRLVTFNSAPFRCARSLGIDRRIQIGEKPPDMADMATLQGSGGSGRFVPIWHTKFG